VASTAQISTAGKLTLEESVVAALRANQNLVQAIGPRIYEEIAPASAVMPFLVYSVGEESQTYWLTGAGSNVTATVSVDVLTRSSAERKSLISQVQTVLDPSTRFLGGSNGVWVAESTYNGTTLDLVDLGDGSGKPARLATVNYELRYKPN
jgi:hypothetical protein